MEREESLFFLIVSLAVFLLGFLIGLLLRGASARRYKKQLMVSEKERVDYEAQFLAANEKQKALSKEVEVLSREKVYAMEQLEVERSQAGSVKDHNPNWVAERATFQDRIQLLTAELEKSQAELVRTQRHLEDLQSSPITAPTAIDEEEAVISEVAQDKNIQAYLDASEARFQAFEDRLAELSNENAKLEARITELTATQTSTSNEPEEVIGGGFGSPHQPVIGVPSVEEEEEDAEPMVIRADTTVGGRRLDTSGNTEVIVDTSPSLQVPVVVPDNPGDRDDLKLIKNIGPFLEKKLYENGIYTYEQIAAWTTADIEYYTKAIGYLPGRILQDDWVGQAAALQNAETAEPDLPEIEEDGEVTIVEDDLKIIEGIGPKIEALLKEKGITTLTTLAEAHTDELRSILAAAGSRYRVHNPDSWPAQAKLASQGKLAELKTMQAELNRGK
ncbi:MAG: helix-hairpin-helix domain-containing protein, partial [Bacteroidota bacterium]